MKYAARKIFQCQRAALGSRKLLNCSSPMKKPLKEAAALDFDDLLTKTVELLQNSSEIRQKWQCQFEYILIDEYQDTNAAQYARSNCWLTNGVIYAWLAMMRSRFIVFAALIILIFLI